MTAVRIRSWHLPSGLVSRGGMIHTLCGRWAPVDAPRADTMPGDEKTCERCLVVWQQQDERGPDSPSGELPS